MSSSTARPWSERVAWTVVPPLVRGLGRVVWRLDFDLRDRLPDPPFVVASNHFSFLDGLVIGAAFRRKVRFLTLVDLFGNFRWLDFALTAVDVIPLNREVIPLGPMRTALGHLASGGAVGLFPEGTRRPSFDPMRVRPGAAWLAARADVPLIPVAVTGTDTVLGVDNRLHLGRIRVAVGPPLHPAGTDRTSVDDLMFRWGRWVTNGLGSA
ncbi:MAG TPA: lysophospholipid acyltransferase family protein [Acidimicrobiia bacterium]